MTRTSTSLRHVVAVAAVALLTLTGCGAGQSRGGGTSSGDGTSAADRASDTGVSATSVKVGGHFPLTGVAAPGYSEIPTGAKAYFDYVNAAGGVNGRTIEYVVKDDAYNPANTSQVVNELVLKDQVFALVGGLGTPTHSAVLDFLAAEKVPDLFVSSGSRLWNQPDEYAGTFGWQPDYEVEGKIIGQHLRDTFPDAKIGLFLQDDDFGTDGEAGVRAFVDDQIVAAERYTPGNTDIGPQMAALKAAGADLVVAFTVPSYTALTQLAALRLRYDPQWVYSNVGSDPALVGSLLERFSEGAVKGSNLLDGALTTEYLAGVDATDDPWVQLWQRVWDAHGTAGELTNYRIYGMAQAYTFVQALTAAGPNPTRASLVEAVQRDGAQWQGPGLAPFRFSADSHAGMSGVKVTRVTGTSSEDLTAVLLTDNGDAPIRESDRAASAPPADGVPD